MPPAASYASPVRTLAHTAETLIIALAGGAAFTLLGFPAGLISGSVLAVAAAALLGRPVRVPVPLARIGYVLIGILLGAVVTSQTVKGFTAWPVSIALVMVAAVCMLLATATYLRMVHGWDRLSALLGASPGSMTQVIALSTELGADLPAIAIVQTMRVLLLTTGIPVGLALFGLVAPALPVVRGSAGGSSLAEIALLAAVSCATAIVFWRLRFPAGLLFGAMVGSGLLHGFGLVQAVLRWWIGSASVLVLGAGRLALCQSDIPAARRLSGRRLRIICGVALGRHALRADRGLFLSLSDRQYRRGVLTRGAGHDDGAGARAASRPGLRGGASRGAFRRHRVLDRLRGPRDRAGREARLTVIPGRPADRARNP
jgi:membrane AbrB-like protein